LRSNWINFWILYLRNLMYSF